MPELLIYAVLVLAVGASLWLLHRGAGPVDDEPPTLDVQNHLGDPDDPTSGSH